MKSKSLREEMSEFLDSDDAYNSYENIDIEYCVNGILKLIEKEIKDLQFEYDKRGMFNLDQKVIFEDIHDIIIEGKTYKDIFYDE